MEKPSPYQRLFLGRKLLGIAAVRDMEFSRKTSLIITIYILALVLQSFFAIFDYFLGAPIQSTVNAAVVAVLICGYLYQRASGNLTVGALIIVSVFSAHFAYNFLTDIDRSLWVLTIPLASFFLLGVRGALLLASSYFGLIVVLMFFGNPASYPVAFKTRLAAVYLSITIISFFFERFRRRTQDQLTRNRLMLEIQRDVSAALSAEIEINAALNRVLDILTTKLPDIDSGGIYLLDDRTGRLRLAVHRGLSSEFVKAVSVYGADSPNVKVVLGGSPVYSTHADIGIPLDEVRRGENLKALAVVPVRNEGRVVAALNCASHRSGEIPPELRRLLESTASSIGDAIGRLLAERDLHAAEDRLSHSQKLEAIGQLAGGIAHDFNNQLTSIMGFADLIRHSAAGGSDLAEYADGILLSANRAASLTRQLLAFARKGKYQSIRVDIHQIIGEVFTMLQHTIDKKIALKQHLGASPSEVQGDPSQLHNALLNVALNARDAMPAGGELTFSTELRVFDKQENMGHSFDLSPGTYCVISVTDTGTGMDEETRKRLFEPFFTTKEKGTGMGLPAVYGIVKVHQGAVVVESEKGRGTAVKIYLPVFCGGPEADAARPPEAAAVYTSPKALRILFVDDEKNVRAMAIEMLKLLGHAAVTCENGTQAVAYYRTSWQSVDLVVLDMIMPVMGGKETFAALRKINPAVRVILSSGYSLEGEAAQILAEGVLGFIQKPYTTAAFAELLSSVMRKQ